MNFQPPEVTSIFKWRNAEGETFEQEVDVAPEVATAEIEKVKPNGLAIIPTRSGPHLMVWVGSLVGVDAKG